MKSRDPFGPLSVLQAKLLADPSENDDERRITSSNWRYCDPWTMIALCTSVNRSLRRGRVYDRRQSAPTHSCSTQYYCSPPPRYGRYRSQSSECNSPSPK